MKYKGEDIDGFMYGLVCRPFRIVDDRIVHVESDNIGPMMLITSSNPKTAAAAYKAFNDDSVRVFKSEIPGLEIEEKDPRVDNILNMVDLE